MEKAGDTKTHGRSQDVTQKPASRGGSPLVRDNRKIIE